MQEIDQIVKMLDGFAQSEGGRLKVEVSGQMEEGEMKKSYHHGRCDIGSPFATGRLYDFDD